MQTDLFGQPCAAPAAAAALHLPAALPTGLYLGTSSWSFPGWTGLVYENGGNESALAREGLREYSRHALLRAVGIDRGFYAPLSAAQYANYAKQVPPGFRFVVKAPNLITDAQIRSERGVPAALNNSFLDAVLATDQCVAPCVEGLAGVLGALVFQLSPLPRAWLADTAAVVDRLARFFAALPPLPGSACYALEIRDSALLTPRLMRALAASSVRYCLGVHASMPPVQRQAKALALLPPGPLVVRWSLHAGLKYQAAKDRYFPFNRLVDPDPATRSALAALAVNTIASGHTATLIANNKAEGSAPLTLLEFAREVQLQMQASG